MSKTTTFEQWWAQDDPIPDVDLSDLRELAKAAYAAGQQAAAQEIEHLKRVKTAAIAEHASLHIPGFHPGCQLCAALDSQP